MKGEIKMDSSTDLLSTYSLNSISTLLVLTLTALVSGNVQMIVGGTVSGGPPPGGACPAQSINAIAQANGRIVFRRNLKFMEPILMRTRYYY